MYLFLYQFIYFHGKGATSWASYKRQVIPSCINSVTVGYNKIDKIIWTIVTSFFFWNTDNRYLLQIQKYDARKIKK